MTVQNIIENAVLLGRYLEDLKKGDISKENARDLSRCLKVLSKELEPEQPNFSKLMTEAAAVCETGKSAPCLDVLNKIG